MSECILPGDDPESVNDLFCFYFMLAIVLQVKNSLYNGTQQSDVAVRESNVL